MSVTSGSPITAESLNEFVNAHQDDWKLLFNFSNKTASNWTSNSKIYTSKQWWEQPEIDDINLYQNKPIVCEWTVKIDSYGTMTFYTYQTLQITTYRDSWTPHFNAVLPNTGTTGSIIYASYTLTKYKTSAHGSFEPEDQFYVAACSSRTVKKCTLGSTTLSDDTDTRLLRVWLIEAPNTNQAPLV